MLHLARAVKGDAGSKQILLLPLGRILMDFDYVVVPCFIVLVAILVSWLCIRRILALRAKGYRMWRHITERVVLSFVVLVAVAVGASTAFNALATLYYRATMPGKSYDVGGYKMHIYCTGQGSPTLLLDAGLGGDWTEWGAVQPELSKTTRVCSYDRAGFGGSAPRPGTRDADNIAHELHELLAQAGTTGPIILMGHSIAGLYIRDYAALYPQQVVGVVLVDSSFPLADKTPVFEAMAASIPLPKPTVENFAQRADFILGIPRLLGYCSQIPPGWNAHAGKRLAEDVCPPPFAAINAEARNMDQSGLEALRAKNFGNLPILIFSEDPNKPFPLPGGWGKKWSAAWNQMQDQLMDLSTRSRRIIANGSGHPIPIERPDLLNKEVAIFVQQVRGTIPQPTDYGSTTTE
jgi:pimeloyl-ACP methyl ester carboxylesterase